VNEHDLSSVIQIKNTKKRLKKQMHSVSGYDEVDMKLKKINKSYKLSTQIKNSINIKII
jgi:translation initiation factor 1 (eIF-1/SUI1)